MAARTGADFPGCDLLARQIQAGVDDMAGIIFELRQIIVGRVVVAHVQDVERAGAVDLADDRQIVRADAGFKQAGSASREASPPWVEW